MSKELEALDRLWEETKGNLDTSPFSNRSDRDLILQALYKLDKLERLKKIEKLLELYKEINNKRKELITLSRHNTWSWKLDIEIKELEDKIKEEKK